ncbi:DnaA regulatory inactivator HdaA [Shinella pollutisoli]|uniref:DnaA regulatory inactivator HdaA n=1 Tax=Shinella pollutisoli TaxID=2250594 RepID=A0ABV7DAV1_9HYPH|nr:DnaA regulatory inactivator HdaA [Shinella pollutisoli]
MTSRKTAEQLPLAFGHEPATGRDDLLVAAPVNAAVALVDAWPDWRSPVAVIAGPVGSGKSHLAAVWREKAGAALVVARPGAGAEEAAARGPVLVEDADRDGFDDRTLFHMINTVRQNGHTLMMTSRLWPMSWPVTLPDLASRLKAATVVEIGEPDDELLSQVIVKLFADRQLFVDDRLVAYIVARMERSLEAAQTLVERLDRLALSRGSRITRALARQVLGEMVGGED